MVVHDEDGGARTAATTDPLQQQVASSSDGEKENHKLNQREDSPTPQQALQEQNSTFVSPSSEKIDKAVRFWMHPSLGNVSSDEKLQYLRTRIGLTDEEIHGAWDRLIQETDASNAPASLPLHRNLPPQQPLNNGLHHRPQPNQLPHLGMAPPEHSSWPTTHSHYPAAVIPPPPLQPPYETETGTSSPVLVPLWLTLGGFVGVAVAAAVRWLNGGDFCLFPPPQLSSITATKTSVVLSDQPHIQNNHPQIHNSSADRFISSEPTREAAAEEEDDNCFGVDFDQDVSPAQATNQHNTSCLTQQVQSLTETLEAHVRVQQRLLQKLASETTDRSMNLLQPKGVEMKPTETLVMIIWSKLVEIRVELSSIQSTLSLSATKTSGQVDTSNNDDGSDDVTLHLRRTLDQLESCIGELSSLTVTPVVQESTQSTVTSFPANGTIQMELSSNDDLKAEQVNHHQGETNEISQLEHLPSLKDVIRTLAEDNESTALRVGAQLLYLYVIHLLSNPHVPRYRKIFTANESFAKVQQLHGGVDLLRAVGFVERESYWEWQSDHEDHVNYKDVLLERLRQAAASLSILKSPGQSHAESSEHITSAALAVFNIEAAGDDENLETAALSPSTPFTPTSFRSSTPLPHAEDQTRSRDMESPLLFQTPEPATNNIVSPPTTKKHPFLSPEEFTSDSSRLPIQHDTANVDAGDGTFQATSSECKPDLLLTDDDQIAEDTSTVGNDNQSSNGLTSPAAVAESQIVTHNDAATGKRLLFDFSEDLRVTTPKS